MADHQPDIQSLLLPDERLILLTDTDVTRDGSFGQRWLAVTTRRVMTFGAACADPRPETELALADLTKATASHRVGHVALEAETDGRRVELLCCTNSLSDRFTRIARALTDARRDDCAPEFDLDEEPRRCTRCGRLLPEKGGFCPACLKKGQVLARFWGYLRPHWRRVLAVSACILLATAMRLVPPYLIKVLVDDVLLGTGGARVLLGLVVALATVHVGAMVVEIGQGRLAAWVGARIMHDVRSDFYRSIQGLSLRRFDKTPTGSLLSRLSHDAGRLNFFLTEIGCFIVPNAVQLVGIGVMLFVLNWRLALLVLVPTPLLVAVTTGFYQTLRRRYHRLWQRHGKMNARANDTITGIRVVKAFAQEPSEVRHFGQQSEQLYHATAAAEGLFATAFPIIAFLTTVGSFMVWYFGGLGVLGEAGLIGPISFGTLMAFLGYLAMFVGPLRMLTRFSDLMNRSITAAQRLFEITDADQEVYDAPDAAALDQPRGAFHFEGVHFGYLKDKPVLKGIDLAVEPGEMIGLVGKSGVGKTTITNLICRFYDVDEGRITLDGVDVRGIKLRDLRQHIGIVPQDPLLFNASIADNLAYGRPDATREDLIRAAIAANAHGFIVRFPDGYDTRVGERGARLSAGEKQRIAIARAILHDPKILILDEATSSVDTETEQLIQEALTRLVRNRTTFAIAHRLSTLRHADRLVVIEDGKIAELGTHEELLAKRGTYHRLVELQSKLSSIKAVDG